MLLDDYTQTLLKSELGLVNIYPPLSHSLILIFRMRIIISKTNPSSKTPSHGKENMLKIRTGPCPISNNNTVYQTQVLNPPRKNQGTTSSRLGLVPLERPNAPQWLRCRCVWRWDHRRRPVTHPPRLGIQNELPSAKLLCHPWLCSCDKDAHPLFFLFFFWGRLHK